MSVPIFSRTEEGVRIDTPWPAETVATRQFVETAEPQWVQRKWRTLSFTLLNGSAAYRIVGRDYGTATYVLRRVG